MNEKRIVCVLGMHRSGTSVITRGLEAIGVELGGNLMPGQVNNNEKGFFEDVEINQVNESVLSRLGTKWYAMAPIEEALLTSRSLAPERGQACTVLRDRMRSVDVFGFKDPRVSVLLPFWQMVFDQLGLEENYVIAIRNPLDVAELLTRRDGSSRQRGLVLWLKYMAASVHHTQNRSRLLMSYDQVLLQPLEELNCVAQLLRLPLLTANSEQYCRYAGDFLAKDMRHTQTTTRMLDRAPDTPPLVASYYRTLMRSQGEKGPGPELQEQVDACRSWLASIAGLLELQDGAESSLHAAWQQLALERAENEAYRGRLTAIEGAQSQTETTLAAMRDVNANLVGELAQTRSLLAETERRLETEQTQCRALAEKLAAAEKDVRALRDAMGQQTAEALTIRAEAEALFAARSSERESAAAADTIRLEQTNLTTAIARDAALAKLAEAEKALATLKASTCWRITAPLRSVGDVLGRIGLTKKDGDSL